MDHEGNQSNDTRNLKNVNFVPKDSTKFYNHIKFPKSIMNSEVRSTKKSVFKNLLRKHQYPDSFFNKNACL